MGNAVLSVTMHEAIGFTHTHATKPLVVQDLHLDALHRSYVSAMLGKGANPEGNNDAQEQSQLEA